MPLMCSVRGMEKKIDDSHDSGDTLSIVSRFLEHSIETLVCLSQSPPQGLICADGYFSNA